MTASLQASAGSLESNDIHITLTPSGSERNEVSLQSIVIRQFGPAIRAVIEESLTTFDVRGVHVAARDKGALDCTIRARMETALARYKELLP